MTDTTIDTQKRRMLKLAAASVVAVPLSGIILQRTAVAGELPRLSEDDTAARALKYVHDANAAPAGQREEGALCKNCNLIQSDQGTWRPCMIFPGKAVNENGWCAGWVPAT